MSTCIIYSIIMVVLAVNDPGEAPTKANETAKAQTAVTMTVTN